LFQDGFPKYLKDDVAKVAELIHLKTYCDVRVSTSVDIIQYHQYGVEIKFPYRMYHTDIPDEVINKLSLQQKMILHCIYSRSCDGFIRQKHLRSLLLMNYEDWAIPYIIKVCDEYVIEILEMTYDFIKDQDTEKIKRFCFDNAQSFCKSYYRMVSYWNEYYRNECDNFREYIGRRLFIECFGYSQSLERIKRA
jgi:hypothetical protein